MRVAQGCILACRARGRLWPASTMPSILLGKLGLLLLLPPLSTVLLEPLGLLLATVDLGLALLFLDGDLGHNPIPPVQIGWV